MEDTSFELGRQDIERNQIEREGNGRIICGTDTRIEDVEYKLSNMIRDSSLRRNRLVLGFKLMVFNAFENTALGVSECIKELTRKNTDQSFVSLSNAMIL
ncbi:hypothetical protein V6N11_017333 [Hibiscus sabdariffa]|uniref:Uncharacterized protein n=1 Tax=Hibiscus sabdariffa TaxID=183260 RepID=A0ABR2TXV1_9ROSI